MHVRLLHLTCLVLVKGSSWSRGNKLFGYTANVSHGSYTPVYSRTASGMESKALPSFFRTHKREGYDIKREMK